MLTTSSLFTRGIRKKEDDLIRTISFRTERFIDNSQDFGLGLSLSYGMKEVTKRKESKVQELLKARGIEVNPEDINKNILEEVPEIVSKTCSIYHWITLTGETPISEQQIADSINDLCHYYKLRNHFIYDLLIPKSELVILGHPDAEEIAEQQYRPNMEDDYYGGFVEGVTCCIKPEGLKEYTNFHLKTIQ